MAKITKIKGLNGGYPEPIIGTNEWFSCSESKDAFCDLYEAEEIIKLGKEYSGMVQHLIHYPEGTVYKPFTLQKNIYVEAPIFNNGKLYFLMVDFTEKIIKMQEYNPLNHELNLYGSMSLLEIKDCYNLKLKAAPLILGRDENDGFYEIVWPEKRKIAIGETETVCFRDEDKLYCSEWKEESAYFENIIVREYATGNIIEKKRGSIVQLADGICWMISDENELNTNLIKR